MYKITYVHKNETEEHTLYIPADEHYHLVTAKLSVECGKSGELSLDIPDDNPAKSDIQCLTDEVIVYRDEKEIWRGRPITMQIDFNLTGSLTCEGILSYLYDTYFEPFEFQGSPKELLQWLLDNHNSKVDERKQFKLGDVTVEDNNDYINRSSINYDRTLSVMTDKLSGSALGGVFRARVEDDGRYIDYISSYEGQSGQPVQYGYNLLDIAQDIEYGDLATVILPLGAKLQDEEGMDTDDRLTIESVNGGSIYYADEASVEKYGWIVVEMEWDDVTVASNLLDKAKDALAQMIMPISQFTIKAVDMSLADPELDPINLGDYVLIRVDAFGVNQYVELTGMDIDMLDPVNSTLQFGTDAATLSGTTNNTQRSVQESMNSLSVRFDNLSTNVLNAVYANIETIVAGTITTDYIQAAVADLGYVTADWVEANTVSTEYLEANYASIYDLDVMFEYVVSLEAEIADIGTLFADYATIQDLTAALAYIGDLYVGKEEVAELLAGYATIVDLNAVSANIGTLTADVADIVSLLAGEAGVGILESIHLTTDNAVIDEAVIVEALVGTVIADIIQSNVIYTDYITIMSENGGIVLAGTTMQFCDENGTVRLQLGQDASGNFTFVLYDETGTGIMIDSEGIHESAVPDGLIVNDMVADDANISASKLDIADLTETLNANGDLILSAEQITIGGGTLDYTLTEIQQQISELEAYEGIEYVENYYAITTNPDWYPPQGESGDGSQTSILGEMVLGEAILGYGGASDWTTERLVASDGEYLWYSQLITYADGHTVWTTPTLITDDYIRTTVTVTQTELEVVQGQIQAKVWQSDIDTAVNSLGDEISTITDQYALLTVTLNEIDQRVGSLTTTVDQYYTELNSQVTSLTLDLDGITAQVRDVSEKTANAITEGTPYYAVSTTPDWYPPHEADGDTAVLGEMVLGKAVLGFSGDDWTEDQPEYTEGQYIWLSYLRERVDGSTYWTEPTLLTDEWARQSYSEMTERYSQLVLEVDSALLEVVSVRDLLTSEYSTTGETRAAIEMAVEDSEASILIIVSDLETTVTNELTTMSDRVSEVYADLDGVTARVQDVETSTKNALTDGVPYYATSTNPDWYPEHEYSDTTTAVLGTGVLGQMILGASNSAWTTDQPKYQEGQYIWLSYLRTRVDGSTYWTEPTLLTDEYLREATTEISTRYSQLVLEIDSALLEVYNLQEKLANDYSTTTETHAYIQEVADDEHASIISDVSDTYATKDALTSTENSIKQYVDSETSSVLTTVSGTYATKDALTSTENSIRQYVDSETSAVLTTVSGTYATKDSLKEYTNTADMQAYVNGQISAIKLSVTNGELGKTASIVMTAGDTSITQSIDMENVRKAFADDTTAITISAGTVTFNTGTLIINGGNLTLSSSGNATFSGTLSAPSGTIGGWTIGSSSLYNGTTSMTSTIVGTYIGTNGIRQYASSSAYVNIQNGVVTAYGATISGTITATTLTCSNGTIGGWTIGSSALYNGTSSMTSTTNGTYIGTDGIRQYRNGAYINFQNSAINTVSGNYETELGAGRLYTYYDGGLFGSLEPIYSSGEPRYYSLLANADLDVSVSIGCGATGYIFVNGGNNPNGYSEKVQLAGTTRITGSLYCRAIYTNGYSIHVNDNCYIESVNSGSDMRFSGGDVYTYNSCAMWVGNTKWTGGYMLGVTGAAYASGGWAGTSDETLKDDINPLSTNTETFLDKLTPISFKFKDDEKGKTHFGVTYQNVCEALEAEGIDPAESGLVGTMSKDGGEEKGVLYYDELIAPMIYEIQQLKAEIAELKKKIA